MLGDLLVNDPATWANSAAAGTEVELEFDGPAARPRDAIGGLLAVFVHNPSAVTALEVRLEFDFEDSGGTTRQATLSTVSGDASFTVSAGSTRVFLVDGGAPDGGRVVVSNATVLGGADGFTAQVRVQSI